MHNVTDKTDAISHIQLLVLAYRNAQDMARGCYGPVLDAHKRKIANARNQLRTAIFCHRENIFEGVY